MIVTTTDGTAGLIDSLDFKSFKLVHGGERDLEAVGRILFNAGAGYILGEFAWIYEEWLRRTAGDAGAEWITGFDVMVRLSRSKGWFDEQHAAVRAHIEWGSRDA